VVGSIDTTRNPGCGAEVYRYAVLLTVVMLLLAVVACGTGPVRPDCDRIGHRAGSGFYENNPTYLDLGSGGSGWETATPQAEHLDEEKLDVGADYLSRNETLRSLLIVQHGKIAYERYFHGGGVDKSMNIHSVAKSIIQALLAIAVDRGLVRSLDDPVSSYLPGYPNAGRITVRNLIEMRSGLRWTEDSTEYQIGKERDWVWAILSQGLDSMPGTVFTYSTGNTHVLAAILQAATRTNLCRFASEHLFGPLAIDVEHWGRDPQGVYSGGYNMYMTSRELARFGLLYVNQGVVDGRRVLPEWAVAAARSSTSDDRSMPAYSQGWWTRTVAGRDMYFAWGYGGQFVFVIPEIEMVLVITQSTGGRERQIDAVDFLERYLIAAMRS
jgi:CubicO group peptidase (beta-lactamase class C family)